MTYRWPCPVRCRGITYWAHHERMLDHIVQWVARWTPQDQWTLERYRSRDVNEARARRDEG